MIQLVDTLFHGLRGLQPMDNALFWKDYDVSTQPQKCNF